MKRTLFSLAALTVFFQVLVAQKPLLIRTDMRWSHPEYGPMNWRADYSFKKNEAGQVVEKKKSLSMILPGNPEFVVVHTEKWGFDEFGRAVWIDQGQKNPSYIHMNEYAADGKRVHCFVIQGDSGKRADRDSIRDEKGQLSRVDIFSFDESGDSLRTVAFEKFQFDEKNCPLKVEHFQNLGEKRLIYRTDFVWQKTTDSLLFQKKFYISWDSSEHLDAALIYDRDERGRPVRLWKVLLGGGGSRFFQHPRDATVRVQESVWEYDEAGLASKISYRDSLAKFNYTGKEDFEGIGWSPTARVYFRYDENGRVVEQRSPFGDHYYLNEFFYDPEHGQLKTTIGYEISGNDLEKPKIRKGKPVGRADYYYEGEEPRPKPVHFEVSLSPNPVAETARFAAPSLAGKSFEWAVYSMDGREILNGNGADGGEFNTADWPTGVYFLKITAENGDAETVVFEKI